MILAGIIAGFLSLFVLWLSRIIDNVKARKQAKRDAETRRAANLLEIEKRVRADIEKEEQTEIDLNDALIIVENQIDAFNTILSLLENDYKNAIENKHKITALNKITIIQNKLQTALNKRNNILDKLEQLETEKDDV